MITWGLLWGSVVFVKQSRNLLVTKQEIQDINYSILTLLGDNVGLGVGLDVGLVVVVGFEVGLVVGF